MPVKRHTQMFVASLFTTVAEWKKNPKIHQLDKQNMESLYNGILFEKKKELNSERSYDID